MRLFFLKFSALVKHTNASMVSTSFKYRTMPLLRWMVLDDSLSYAEPASSSTKGGPPRLLCPTSFPRSSSSSPSSPSTSVRIKPSSSSSSPPSSPQPPISFVPLGSPPPK